MIGILPGIAVPGLAQETPVVDPVSGLTYHYGGIIRTSQAEKRIHLVFTGDEFADGYEVIKNALDKHGIKATFFFTGNFYRNTEFAGLIRQLIADGHYLGAHSDRHLLYAAWENRDSLLVTEQEFKSDLRANYALMKKFGIKKKDAPYFMPPYEWYNQQITDWTAEMGLTLVNFTPGTSANQDWSYPELGKGYFSTEKIFEKILAYEAENTMNGFILLTHIGADPRRPDKLYHRLDELIALLKDKGYFFSLLD